MFITTAGGGMIAATVLGGLLGDGGSQQAQSTQQSLDPRMADAIYGTNGVVPSAQDWYSQHKTGLNAQMLEGMNRQYAQHGASRQGFNQMQNLGMSLMGGGAAGNPFAGGYSGGMNGQGGGMAPQPQTFQPATLTNPFQNPLQGYQFTKGGFNGS